MECRTSAQQCYDSWYSQYMHSQMSARVQRPQEITLVEFFGPRSDPILPQRRSLDPLPTTINPNDLLHSRNEERSGSTSTDPYPSTYYEVDSPLFTKRQTRLRQKLDDCSSGETRMRMLPNVPQCIVDRFWVVYHRAHDPARRSPPPRDLFKDFYEVEEDTNKCKLCNHRIRNPTQIVQHVMGLHFDLFGHRCKVQNCSFSSVRAADLKRHISEQHQSQGYFKCKICGQGIKHKKNLPRHMKARH